MPPDPGAPRILLTVGHGASSAEDLTGRLHRAGVAHLVDVRTAPGSRRHPQFARAALAEWLPAAGVAYRWEPDLGGWRRPRPDSPNVALRNDSFRGYADYMDSATFTTALDGVAGEADRFRTAVMCSETLWWRCHRRLIADAATLLLGFEVRHLTGDGRLAPHRLTDGVRRAEGGGLRYDAGQPRLGDG